MVTRWAEGPDDTFTSLDASITDTNTEDDSEPSLQTPPITSYKSPVSILAAIGKKSIKKSVKFADVESSSDSESRASASDIENPLETVESDVSSSSQTAKKKRYGLRRRVLAKDGPIKQLSALDDTDENVTQSADADSSTENQSESGEGISDETSAAELSQENISPDDNEDTEKDKSETNNSETAELRLDSEANVAITTDSTAEENSDNIGKSLKLSEPANEETADSEASKTGSPMSSEAGTSALASEAGTSAEADKAESASVGEGESEAAGKVGEAPVSQPVTEQETEELEMILKAREILKLARDLLAHWSTLKVSHTADGWRQSFCLLTLLLHGLATM